MRVTYRFVPGFDRRYRVGDDGSVWSHRGTNGWCRLRPERHNRISHGRRANRYLRINLWRGGKAFPFLVHQLVLLVFVGPCPPGMVPRHFPDPDPDNNRLSNLRYGTKSDNYRDWVACGGGFDGNRSSSAKLTKIQRDEIAQLVAGGLSQEAAGARYGVHQSTVSLFLRKRTYKTEPKEIV